MLSPSLMQLLIGGILAAIAAVISWGLRWLKGSGALAAFILGLVVFGLGGLSWAYVLLAFFVTSSLLSILFKNKKEQVEKSYEKSSRRDAGQVFANGAIAGLFVVAHVFFPDSRLTWTGFVAALAAANADTWATELGILSKHDPILITNGKPVTAGTSGAVSLTGMIGAVLGSAVVVLVAWFFWPGAVMPARVWWIPVVLFCGWVGSLVDSWLGARFQTIYFCPACQKETEREIAHGCGTATVYLRGWRWMDNDWVNLLCTCVSALLALLLMLLCHI